MIYFQLRLRTTTSSEQERLTIRGNTDVEEASCCCCCVGGSDAGEGIYISCFVKLMKVLEK